MHWIILFVAGLFEVGWAIILKLSDGFSKVGLGVLALVVNLMSVGLLALAMKDLPLGSSYAIWTGIGIIGTFVLGIVLFHDSFQWQQLVCVLLILTGIVGLRLLTPAG